MMLESVETFAKIIRDGGIVAFPTETVYGLGANAFDESAVKKIFEAKKRPADNPLIVHIASLEWLNRVAENITPVEMDLFRAFSPGPLTVLLKKKKEIPDIVTAGSPLVGVRIPRHAIALELIEKAGVPIAAPSANISGKPSATHHDHVMQVFGTSLPVIKAGAATFGVESTVVKVEHEDTIYILRQGAISIEDILEKFPHVQVKIAGKENDSVKASPGTRYRHYAPKGKMLTINYGPVNDIAAAVKSALNDAKDDTKIAIISATEILNSIEKKPVHTFDLGTLFDPRIALERLYAYLLECDRLEVDDIIIHLYKDAGLGKTFDERVRRAEGSIMS